MPSRVGQNSDLIQMLTFLISVESLFDIGAVWFVRRFEGFRARPKISEPKAQVILGRALSKLTFARKRELRIG